jgi:fructose-1,6-bisphosphatase/inositol monophosphatase family enzyme
MLIYNNHVVEIVLKSLVTRAIGIAKRTRFVYTVSEKPGYQPNIKDVYTNVDVEIQEMYVKKLLECFPGFGIIGEEGCLINPDADIYFVIDPLDGTRAFIEKWSRGIGTMISMVAHGKVVSAWIGDVNTGEVYGYRPDSNHIWRLQEEYQYPENLSLIKPKKHPNQITLLSQKSESQLTPHCLSLVPQFESIAVERGSIGLLFTRLIKKEVGAILLQVQNQTPWDNNTILGFAETAGFRYHKFSQEAKRWKQYQTSTIKSITEVDHEILIIDPTHAKYLV